MGAAAAAIAISSAISGQAISIAMAESQKKREARFCEYCGRKRAQLGAQCEGCGATVTS